MATIADLKKQEKDKKKKEKRKKVKILLSKHPEERKTLDSGNVVELEGLLESVLRPAKLEKFKYSWAELKKIPKEKRRESRNALMIGLDKEKYEKAKKIRDNFVFGTNSIIRSLEKDKILCGVVSPDFDPAMISDHIVSLARQRKIPVILLTQLRAICERCLGFPVKALGIKKKDSILHDKSYTNLHSLILHLSGLADLEMEPTESHISMSVVSKSASSHPTLDRFVAKDLILKRPNKSTRCFVPGGTSQAVVSMDDLDFISLGTSTAAKNCPVKDKSIAPEEDDDSDSDSSVKSPSPKLKPYVSMFKTLKLKKIKSKS